MENNPDSVQLEHETNRKPRNARSPSNNRGQALREGYVVDGSGCDCGLQRVIGTSLEEIVEARQQATVQASFGKNAQIVVHQRSELVAALTRGTRYWGYAPDGWSGPLVRDVIQRLFGVEFHPEYVPRLLHQLGWSPQKPERRARERNEADIARWRRETWPRLKKEP